MTDLTPADLLDKAAEHIEIIGWWQGDYSKITWSEDLDWYVPDEECPACAVGAINIAASTSADSELEGRPAHAARALAERLGLVADDDCLPAPGAVVQYIGNWNDADGRTAEQVVAELRACAADLRQGEG